MTQPGGAVEFVDLVNEATGGVKPYPYQIRLALEGAPELLAVPTGCGKTMAAVLPWLYRRRFHPDLDVRAATPRWLVFVLPMRVLVEQTTDAIKGWITNLGLEQKVGCHTLLGGEPLKTPWRQWIDRDAIIVGTLDMILSRALNRGYGESRYLWPIDFGLLNAGCHYVFDELQLMGPALSTSRQMHGLREVLGTSLSCTATWMSATVPEDELLTVDAPTIATRLELDDADRSSTLRRRLSAAKRVEAIELSSSVAYPASVAGYVASRHREGSITIAVLNTVDRARAVHDALVALGTSAEVVLLHSRFRPRDRRVQVERALSPVDATGPGRIIVSTQVIEAGVDLSADLLVTELAPWASIVQRAGRCNRDGQAVDAVLAWVAPPQPAPYPQTDLDASLAALGELTGSAVTPDGLRQRAVSVSTEIRPVLRRRDMLDLFDTLPDLTGNDIDVARFIRDADELDVTVAWRAIGSDGPAVDAAIPGRDERCPVSLRDIREVLKAAKGSTTAWSYDHIAARFAPVGHADLKPGMVLVLDVSAGMYDSTSGWHPGRSEPVVPVDDEPAADDQSIADDPVSVTGAWVTLADHLADTEAAARRILASTDLSTTAPSQSAAVIRAAALHDIGKAHEVFQESIRRVGGERSADAPDGVVLAKSGASGRLVHGRRYFRHELASALALLGEGHVAIEDLEDPDLVVYLVAAHHGRVRIGIRPMRDELPTDGQLVALGIHDGERLPAIDLAEGEVPSSILDLSVMALGERDVRASWSSRALALRDRPNLGLFRLGFLEAVVRLADWEASALRDSEVAHG